MNFLWDTNILLEKIRHSTRFDSLNERHGFFETGNRSFISIISIGEIYSLSWQLDWGEKKLARLKESLNELVALPLANQSIVMTYAEMDAFSQGKLKYRPLPFGLSARNMGKNDLWIAATASAIEASLVTTDADFDHLDNVFLKLVKV